MFTSLTTASVFIGYRRDDSRFPADALRRDLQDLGHTVFFDMTHMRAADEYRSVINRALDKCDVAVIVIGPRWLTITDRHGRRRLDDPADVHRVEVARALQRTDVAVLPVLVEGARMPDPEDLPEDIRGLADIQAVEMLPNHWGYGVQEVHETVEVTVRRRWSAWAEAVAVPGLAAIPAGLVAEASALATTHVSGVSPGQKL